MTGRIRIVLENVSEADLEAKTRKNRWNPTPGRMRWGTLRGAGLAHEGGGSRCRVRQAAPSTDSWIHEHSRGFSETSRRGFCQRLVFRLSNRSSLSDLETWVLHVNVIALVTRGMFRSRTYKIGNNPHQIGNLWLLLCY